MNLFFRLSAKIVSGLLHPLVIPTYALFLLLWMNPYLFGVSRWSDESMLIWHVLFMTCLLPFLVVFMMRQLGMVDSIHLHKREERIAPYIATGIFYLWLFINLANSHVVPLPYVVFILGTVIALFLDFFVNNFTKISAHGTGMGGLIAFVLLCMTAWGYEFFWLNMGPLGSHEMRLSWVFLIILVIAGIVGSSRLLLKAHTHKQIYAGFIVGAISQYIAYLILG